MADYIVHKAVEPTALSAKVYKALGKPTDWVLSPKYDGCHVVFLFSCGEWVNTLSRTGESVKSMAHVIRAIKDCYGDLIERGDWAICGEAWAPELEFNEISGLFRRQYPAPNLKFVPFDIVPWLPNLGFSGPEAYIGEDITGPYDRLYFDRISDLARRVGHKTSVIIPKFSYLVGFTLESALTTAEVDARYYKQLGGYDGAVLAQANGRYIVGAGKGGEFIKCKPLISYTVTVTGAALDFGTKTGKNTAALKFMLDGKEQKVSTGLSQQQVEEITAVGWDGYRIEVEAMGITVNGYLREPRFKGIRTDA